MSTLILAMPRSRSTWLSVVLGVPHDPMCEYESVEEFVANMPALSIDTGAALFVDEIMALAPDTNLYTLPRVPMDSAHSLVQALYRENLDCVPAVVFDMCAILRTKMFYAEHRYDARPFELEDVQCERGEALQGVRIEPVLRHDLERMHPGMLALIEAKVLGAEN